MAGAKRLSVGAPTRTDLAIVIGVNVVFWIAGWVLVLVS